MIENVRAFLNTAIGKATLGLFSGVLSACFPAVPGYAVSAACFYYAVHWSRPLAAWLYQDLRNDLRERRATSPEEQTADTTA